MSNLQTASHEIAPTAFARFKSTVARLVGTKPEPAANVVIWSEEWCAQEPATAALAIATLQERVAALKSQIKDIERKPRKHKVSLNPKGVYLSSLPPSTYFVLLRSGDKYRTSGRSWRLQYKVGDENRYCKLHGASRVRVYHPLEN